MIIITIPLKLSYQVVHMKGNYLRNLFGFGISTLSFLLWALCTRALANNSLQNQVQTTDPVHFEASLKLLPFDSSRHILAQMLPPPQDLIQPPQPKPPSTDFQPGEEPFFPSSPQDDRPQLNLPPEILEQIPEIFAINSIEFEGNTAFSDEELLSELEAEIGSELYTPNGNLTDLLQIVAVINSQYQQAGYITTGALLPIPPANGFPEGKVTISIVEGSISEIQVFGTQRLQENYISSRLALGIQKPLQQNEIVDALQLLQEDPLIDSIQATLTAGTELGTNILQVQVKEALSFQAVAAFDNTRTPNVGTLQATALLRERNLSGLGDRLTFSYNHTEGSDGFGINYQLPLNPQNGSLSLAYSQSNSQIIESSVESLGIRSDSQYIDLIWRQPLIRTPRQEFALGLIGSYRDSQAVFGEEIFGKALPYPTPGADETGRTQVTAIRFFQEWSSRSTTEAFTLRSQFSLGLDALGSTVNASSPDSQFFSWRGQAQWRRRLWPNAFVLMGADMQLADRPLLPVEQFTLGGLGTVRGYRQDLLLADNGITATAEVWMPVARVPEPEIDGILYIVPFVDAGTVWDNGDASTFDPNTLASTGLGLRWQQRHLDVRVDWAIPLVNVDDQGDSLQENGIYFSVRLNRL